MKKFVVVTLALVAAISVLGAKVCSRVARAEPPLDGASLAGDGKFLGEFEIKHVFSHEKNAEKGDLCADPAMKYEGGYRCGQRIWAYENENQIALLYAPDESAIETDQFIVFIEGKNCAGSGAISEAQSKGIFHLGLCTVAKQGLDSETVSATGDVPAKMTVASLGILSGRAQKTIVQVSDSEIDVREMQTLTLFWIPERLDKTSVLVPVAR